MSTTHRIPLVGEYNTEIETTIISTIPQLNECLNNLISTIVKNASAGSGSHRTVVGLDIEKMFGNNPVIVSEKVATLTLCYRRTCFIIQLHRMSFSTSPNSLSAFLQLPWLSFVGVGISHCLDALERDYGIKCRNALDLGNLSAILKRDDKLKFNGLFDLADSDLLSCLIDESAQDCLSVAALSDWGVEVLSLQQIAASALGTFLCSWKGYNILGGSGYI